MNEAERNAKIKLLRGKACIIDESDSNSHPKTTKHKQDKYNQQMQYSRTQRQDYIIQLQGTVY